MKNIIFSLVLSFIFYNVIYAQEDERPYLTDDDIAAIEMSLPSDIPELVSNIIVENNTEVKLKDEENEISRLNTLMKIYHLLILDRTSCSANADITGIENVNILYNYKDGLKGYLIAIFTSPQKGPIFPQLPDNSYIILNLTTVRKNTIIEYINSDEFKRFVTSQYIIMQMNEVLNN